MTEEELVERAEKKKEAVKRAQLKYRQTEKYREKERKRNRTGRAEYHRDYRKKQKEVRKREVEELEKLRAASQVQ